MYLLSSREPRKLRGWGNRIAKWVFIKYGNYGLTKSTRKGRMCSHK